MTDDSEFSANPTRPDDSKRIRELRTDVTGEFATGRDGDVSSASGDWWFAEGDRIAGRYVVRCRLGRGGMGEVYEVDDEQAREVRALKVMRAHMADSAEARERFRNESRSRRLNHDNIVSTIDIGESAEQQLLYISMELVDGQSLGRLLKTTRLTPVQALQIGFLICRALEYAHRNGVIHRDIKPDNVLVRLDKGIPQVWLTDFGIAQLQSDQMTKTGAAFGTPSYAAPEQKRAAGDVTAGSDLFSVGVLLYEMLTGNLPEGYFEPASAVVSGLPPGVDELLQEALAGRPENRISDAGLFAARLATCLKSAGHSAPPTASPSGHVADVALAPIIFSGFSARKAPQVRIEGVPGLPDEVLSLEGEVDSLQQTLGMIDAETHPRITEQQQQLAQLADRVQQLQAAADDIRPAELSGNQYVDLERRIRRGDIGPAQLRTAYSNIKMAPLFSYVEQLSHWVTAADRLAEQQERFKNNIAEEKQRLVELLKTKRDRLKGARNKDLRKLISDYFREYRRQNPTADPQRFPLAAWAGFQQQVLAKRRYQLSEVAISEVAEEIWNPKQARRQASDRGQVQASSPQGWGATLGLVLLAHLFVWMMSSPVVAWIGPQVEEAPEGMPAEDNEESPWKGEEGDDQARTRNRHEKVDGRELPSHETSFPRYQLASYPDEAPGDPTEEFLLDGFDRGEEAASSPIETGLIFHGLDWAYSLVMGGVLLLWYSYRRTTVRLLGLAGFTMIGGIILYDLLWPWLHVTEYHHGWFPETLGRLNDPSAYWRLLRFVFVPVVVGYATLLSGRAAMVAAVVAVLAMPALLSFEAPGLVVPPLFVRQQLFNSLLAVGVSAGLMVVRFRLAFAAAFVFWCRVRRRPEPRIGRFLVEPVESLHDRLPWSR